MKRHSRNTHGDLWLFCTGRERTCFLNWESQWLCLMGSDCRSWLYFSETSLSPRSAGRHGYNLDTLAMYCVALIAASNRAQDNYSLWSHLHQHNRVVYPERNQITGLFVPLSGSLSLLCSVFLRSVFIFCILSLLLFSSPFFLPSSLHTRGGDKFFGFSYLQHNHKNCSWMG
jgi:hypothetical protein